MVFTKDTNGKLIDAVEVIYNQKLDKYRFLLFIGQDWVDIQQYSFCGKPD